MGKEDKRQMIFTLTESGRSKLDEMNKKKLEIGIELQNMLK